MKISKSKIIPLCILVIVIGIAQVTMGAQTNDPPWYDDCAHPKQFNEVANHPYDTTYATFDGPGHYITGPNIWICYTATCSGTATVSLAGSSYNTKMAVYNGCTCYPSASAILGTNDDYINQTSQVSFPVVAGNKYLIEVGGSGPSDKGLGQFSIWCDASSGGPTNDNISNAEPIGNVTNKSFDTSLATFDGPGHCMTSPNIWYKYTATGNGNVTVSLCGSSYDTMLGIYNGYSSYPTTAGPLIECNDDACDRQSEITFMATSGNTYLIEVGGYNTETGSGKISISFSGSGPGVPANNNCGSAQQIGNVTNLSFDTTNATFDGPGHCMTSPNIWYCYTASTTGNVTVSLCGSDYDTMLAVYRGCGCPPASSNMIACNDDACDYQSEITFTATAGQKYLIEIGGYGDDTGQGVLNVNTGGGPAAPPNNSCANATALVGNVSNLSFDTTNASFDGPGHCMDSPNIWYCYTATATGDVTVSLCGSSFDTMLAVYRNCACPPSASSLINCNDDACDYQSEITFSATANSKYLIEVGGYGDNIGQGVLNISQGGGGGPGVPENDLCQNATPVSDVTNLSFDLTNASRDGLGHCISSPNIWYVYTATCTGNATVSLCGSEFDTMLAVYQGYSCPASYSSLIACNDDACGHQSEITFTAIAGQKYLIEVGAYSTGYSTELGRGVLTITCGGGTPSDKATDLGDAPDSTNNSNRVMTAYPMSGPLGVRANFPTVYDDGRSNRPRGPIHFNQEAVAMLGESITNETEADTGPDEDGINNINPTTNTPNEDYADNGVIFPLSMPNCRWTTFDYKIKVLDPTVDLWLNVWCDWNRDGDWDDIITDSCSDIPEWAVQNKYLFGLETGINLLTSPAFMSYHPKTGPEQIWMRVTLSEQPWLGGDYPGTTGNGGSGPEDGYLYGETEDLYFIPDTTATICEDFNGDGVINMEDLTVFVNQWLANCP